ncbi:hypothetical protein FVEG_15044 [Fusarium verticillioides 7600]|uniref:Uncharacterized protein n=1 Tax=Gibberella moniliformis (strain M3125 / FGSC 7600) TaxID=334819 RepID=W7M3Z2_GIBM7|nr:hypothetical protein FVEG_15044 [Fusarium verticillioides 7600]XP_018745794.1 hypothetical protein FVEG_15044 [Fusarium verticillioides 7600]EWG39602.1 hypothetical protein FVEG_15044 [Fusarium verticillioides 7600]EWG39603.1 hypothetical protein FVEG_15044 [Fusarium verticillioides 7600]
MDAITIGDESPFLRVSHRNACRGTATRDSLISRLGTGVNTPINLAVIVINVILFCILYLLFVSQTPASATNHAVSHIKIHGFGYLAFTAQLYRLCPRLLGHA